MIVVRDALWSADDEPGIFEVMTTCRAMRRLKPDPVPEELLMKLIAAASCAPSGRNLQRARWIIVRDEEQKRRIAELNRRASEATARAKAAGADSLPHHDAERQRRMYEAVLWQSLHMHEAPALLVACCVLDDPDQDPNRYASSIWPGVQNLLLAARALELGATLTTWVLEYRDELERALELPADVVAMGLIPVGYPTGRFGPVVRRPPEEIAMFERWTS